MYNNLHCQSRIYRAFGSKALFPKVSNGGRLIQAHAAKADDAACAAGAWHLLRTVFTRACYNSDDAARILGISDRQLQLFVRRGQLRQFALGVISARLMTSGLDLIGTSDRGVDVQLPLRDERRRFVLMEKPATAVPRRAKSTAAAWASCVR